MSDPIAAFGLGSELRIFIDPDYVAIPWLQSISGPDETFDTIDATTHSSINGFREYISGLADGGEVTVTINWHSDEDAHAALQDVQHSREVVPFQLFWPQFGQDNLADFSGFVTGLTRASPTDEKITRDLTIKVTGTVEVSTE